MNIKPLKNKLFIKAIEIDRSTKSGLVIVSKDTDKPTKGEVMAIGNEVKEVKVGDIVLFKKYAPDEIEIDKIKYLVGDEDDILAIIK